MYPSAVREMPEDDRPRERLERLGAEALRDAELLAVLFRTGTREMGAVALADMVLRHFGGLREVACASVEQLMEVKGLGRVKAIEIKAALELGTRLVLHANTRRAKIHSAEDLAAILMARFKQCENECFKCVLLNTRHEVLKIVDVATGGLDRVDAVPRDVFRQAVRDRVPCVIMCHNHPSGDPEPSREDLALTKRLVDSGRTLGVNVLDHVIFGDGRYVSLMERNLL